MLLFPLLPHNVSRHIAEDACSASIQSLAERAAMEHSACEYTPTGGARITKAALSKLRSDVLQLAAVAGYPATPDQQQAAAFDAQAAILLAQQMSIAPAEAAKGGTWEFLSCIVLPDVVRWRFAGNEGATSIERFISGRRNAFQRLWWRAYHLASVSDAGQELPRLLQLLGEDELVQLMERPSLAGIHGLPGAIAAGLLAAAEKYSDLTRRQLIREAQKRFLRLSSFLSLESINREDVARLVETVFSQVAAALPRDKSASGTASSHG